MKIAAAAIAMQSQHASVSRQEVRETLRGWVGNQRPDFEQPPTAAAIAQISDSARTAQASEAAAVAEATDSIDGNPLLTLLKSMIEMLTGRPVRVFSPADLGDRQTATEPPAAPAQAPGRQQAGFGIEYDYHAVVEETEQTSFAANGIIKTADGKEFNFQIDLTMARHFREETNVSLRLGDAQPQRKDPLVLNFGGTAAQLSDQRFRFDLDADGQAEEVPLLAGGSGYLALDKNGNGRIDSGAELFGPASGAGFAELAVHDRDGNGWIDENDPIFDQLRIWTPAPGEPGNISSLKQRDVGALYLGHLDTPFELRGQGNSDLGAVKAGGLYLTEAGGAGTVQEIDLTV